MKIEHKQRALAFIAACTDPGQIEQVMINARRVGADDIERAAFLRLCAVLPSAAPGTFEYDVWQSIHALEGALKRERGKTVRLARTRDKIKRTDEHRTVADLMAGKPSDGYDMLIARAMPERTFEAVVLRHPERFSDDERAVAANRLSAAGYDPATLATTAA